MLSTLFMDGGAPNFGWTFYAPLSTTYAPPSVTFFIFAVHMMGISSIMGAINIIATILNMRAPGMTMMKLPLFVWTWLITAFLIDCGYASVGRCSHDDVDGYSFRHQLLLMLLVVVIQCYSSISSGSLVILKCTS